MFAWADRYQVVTVPNFDQVGSLTYYYFRTIDQLVSFAIPTFMFVSGYFVAFSAGRRPNVQWHQIGARVKSLIIPYLIWSFIWIALLFLQGRRFGATDMAIMFLTGRTTPAYYYIPLLVQLYLIAPLVVPLAKKHWQTLLIVSGIVLFLIQGSQVAVLLGVSNSAVQFLGRLPKWFFVVRFFWFALGMTVGFHLKSFKAFITPKKWFFLVAMLALIPIGIWEWEIVYRQSGLDWLPQSETILDSFYAFAFLATFFAFTHVKLPLTRQVENLGINTFGIYLIHVLVMEYVARGISVLWPQLLGYQVIFQLIIIVTGLGIPLLIMEIVRRSPLRGYSKLVFG